MGEEAEQEREKENKMEDEAMGEMEEIEKADHLKGKADGEGKLM